MRDGRVEPLGASPYLNQYGEAPRGEPARLGASISQPSASPPRLRGRVPFDDSWHERRHLKPISGFLSVVAVGVIVNNAG